MTVSSHTTGQLTPGGARTLGEAVALAGTGEGPKAIAAFVAEVVPNDVTAVFAWQAGSRPRHVFENYDAQRRKVATEVYMKGAYLLDPFYVASQDIVSDCVLRLRDVQTDNFRQSEYFRSYYVGTGLIDELSFYATKENRSFLAVSVGRYGGSPTFSLRDHKRACFLLPVIAALVRCQWLGEVVSEPEGEGGTVVGDARALSQVLAQPPFAALTARERDIVALLLRGHSSKSMAAAVAISVGTVKNHRKNIYRKLGVHSQSELFARFLGVIG